MALVVYAWTFTPRYAAASRVSVWIWRLHSRAVPVGDSNPCRSPDFSALAEVFQGARCSLRL